MGADYRLNVQARIRCNVHAATYTIWSRSFVLFTWIRRVIYRSQAPEVHRGIRIASFRPFQDSDGCFSRCTTSALEYLAHKDHRRLNRVLKYVKHIIDMPLRTAATYIRQDDLCCVNFRYLRTTFPGEERVLIEFYASLLVHEATHGRLYSFGSGGGRKRRERLENICVQEQLRFLKRCGHDELLWKELIAKIRASY